MVKDHLQDREICEKYFNKINVSAKREDKPYIQPVFQDNGIGFEQQHSEQIFIIFQRLNNQRSYSGTGIGLALCKKIVDHHEGIIIAKSKPGKGACIYGNIAV